MSPGSSTESYPEFARIGLRENPGKNLNQNFEVVKKVIDSSDNTEAASIRTAQELSDKETAVAQQSQKQKWRFHSNAVKRWCGMRRQKCVISTQRNYRPVYRGVAHDAKSSRLWFSHLLTTGRQCPKQSGRARRCMTEEKVEEIRA
ncbi:hypothetical protein ANN_04761 [Periplaneta americana]|uniref:Uncharacterized protein n=1 Tax=Periplaneta americana TaxID=6978 RepID=A0ABQ8T9A7_PERAM|nr:hypothetical protein ANN_04761 [Periplaneta americana]